MVNLQERLGHAFPALTQLERRHGVPLGRRAKPVHLRAQPPREAIEWLQRYERFWSNRLDRLSSYAERKEAEARQKGR